MVGTLPGYGAVKVSIWHATSGVRISFLGEGNLDLEMGGIPPGSVLSQQLCQLLGLPSRIQSEFNQCLLSILQAALSSSTRPHILPDYLPR